MIPRPPFWIAFLPAGWMLSQFLAVYFVSFGRPAGIGPTASVGWTALWILEGAGTFWLMGRWMTAVLAKHGCPPQPLSARKALFTWLAGCLLVIWSTIYLCWSQQHAMLMEAMRLHKSVDTAAENQWVFIEFAAAIIGIAIMCLGVLPIARRINGNASGPSY